MKKKTISQGPISKSTAKRHSGKWVAIRGTKVAASAMSYGQLRENPRVRQTDAVYRVPDAGSQRFLGTRIP
jgi:hypothetical protein